MIEAIVIKDLYKSYLSQGKKLAVEGFNLEVKQGEFFCLVGPSGCGKSTLLKIIAGLESPSSGQVIKPDTVSVVFQSGALLPWLNVVENVAFGLKMQGISDHKIAEAVNKFLKMVKLEDFHRKYPRELSGGQKQRVGIARALAVDPQLLLLDEPFSALDPITTDELHQDLLNIWSETGKTVLMVSHSLEEAVVLADRVGVMKDGKLIGIIDINLKRP